MTTADRSARWKDIRGACLPVEDLASLADLRGRARMWVAVAEGRAWVWWQADSDVTPDVVARRIMPLEGAELFTRTDGQWYRLGERLPAFGVPMGALWLPDFLSTASSFQPRLRPSGLRANSPKG